MQKITIKVQQMILKIFTLFEVVTVRFRSVSQIGQKEYKTTNQSFGVNNSHRKKEDFFFKIENEMAHRFVL